MDSKTAPPQYENAAAQPQYVAVQPPQQPPQPVGQYAADRALVPGQMVQQPAPVAAPGSAPVQAYQPQQPMQVAVADPNSTEWKSSLMNCQPCDTCLLATFIPCLLLGQTADRMRDPTMATADSCNSDCMIMCAVSWVTGCGWVYVMVKRAEIRERFGIKGGGMDDCCATYWCPCCALIQQEKEVVARTAAPISQGYQSQPGMQMPTK